MKGNDECDERGVDRSAEKSRTIYLQHPFGTMPSGWFCTFPTFSRLPLNFQLVFSVSWPFEQFYAKMFGIFLVPFSSILFKLHNDVLVLLLFEIRSPSLNNQTWYDNVKLKKTPFCSNESRRLKQSLVCDVYCIQKINLAANSKTLPKKYWWKIPFFALEQPYTCSKKICAREREKKHKKVKNK